MVTPVPGILSCWKAWVAYEAMAWSIRVVKVSIWAEVLHQRQRAGSMPRLKSLQYVSAGVEDLLGRFRPGEGPRVLVPGVPPCEPILGLRAPGACHLPGSRYLWLPGLTAQH